MSRLLIISNRLPVKVSKDKDQFKVERSVGGLATGVGSVHESQESLWVGWSGYGAQEMPKEERDKLRSADVFSSCLLKSGVILFFSPLMRFLSIMVVSAITSSGLSFTTSVCMRSMTRVIGTATERLMRNSWRRL